MSPPSHYLNPAPGSGAIALETHGEIKDFEYQGHHRNGSTFWVSEWARVVRDEQGTVYSITKEAALTSPSASRKKNRSNNNCTNCKSRSITASAPRQSQKLNRPTTFSG